MKRKKRKNRRLSRRRRKLTGKVRYRTPRISQEKLPQLMLNFLQVPKVRTRQDRAHRREHHRGHPAENHDPNHDPAPNPRQDQNLARAHPPSPDRGLARALYRIRRLDHARDLVVLNQGTLPDPDPGLHRDRARYPPPNHRHRDLDRDPSAVVAALPVVRAAKALPRASEPRYVGSTVFQASLSTLAPLFRRIFAHVVTL